METAGLGDMAASCIESRARCPRLIESGDTRRASGVFRAGPRCDSPRQSVHLPARALLFANNADNDSVRFTAFGRYERRTDGVASPDLLAPLQHESRQSLLSHSTSRSQLMRSCGLWHKTNKVCTVESSRVAWAVQGEGALFLNPALDAGSARASVQDEDSEIGGVPSSNHTGFSVHRVQSSVQLQQDMFLRKRARDERRTSKPLAICRLLLRHIVSEPAPEALAVPDRRGLHHPIPTSDISRTRRWLFGYVKRTAEKRGRDHSYRSAAKQGNVTDYCTASPSSVAFVIVILCLLRRR